MAAAIKHKIQIILPNTSNKERLHFEATWSVPNDLVLNLLMLNAIAFSEASDKVS